MINLILFIISFGIWLVLIINQKFKWYTYVLAGLWGAFLAQTIICVCGQPTIIDNLMK